jgi:penicillin-binding protein 1C
MKSRLFRLAKILGVAALSLLLTGLAVWGFGPMIYRFPDAEFAARQPSRVFTDRHGEVIRAELASDEQWRLDVPLEAISPHVPAAFIALEDKRFYSHGGIDLVAIGRAVLNNAGAGRIVSGASTISMQLARLSAPEPRSYGAKIRQALRALDLERRHSKDWILTAYLNHTPYGSNILGIEAASRYYFSKAARELTTAESALLVGLPQRPAALRPDRYPEAAKDRRSRVLVRMLEQGLISEEEAKTMDAAPLNLVLAKGPSKLGFPSSHAHFCERAAAGNSGDRVATTLDPDLQARAEFAIRRQVESLPGVDDGAIIIIENAEFAIRAMVGTLDFTRVGDGQVNAAVARRSPGSALKPFLYALAIDGGLIVPDTQLPDVPLAFRDYKPENFDGSFLGEVAAREALVRSLNTPAVRVLESVGVAHTISQLQRCGVRSLDRPVADYGLTLALGGGEVSLLELANAYAGLAREGRFADAWFSQGEPSAAEQPFATGTVALVTQMLNDRPLPGGARMAWKTGTSNGHRDAWCVGYSPSHTIAVWLGNKDGRPSSALIGSQAAAPVVGQLALAPELNRGRFAADEVIAIDLCTRTGLRATAHCAGAQQGDAVAGIPLRPCPGACAADSARTGLKPRIVSPTSGTYVAEGAVARLRVAARDGENGAWYVNGEFVGWTPHFRDFLPGEHRITCLFASGTTDAVELLVR